MRNATPITEVRHVNGTALYRARLGKGMTLREVADECTRRGCPVDAANLARAERGLPGGIGPRKIPVLAQVLDLSMNELVPDEPDEAAA